MSELLQRAYNYLNDVRTGKIVAGKYVIKAVERHFEDIERSKSAEYPYYFSEQWAAYALNTSETITLSIGEKSGQPFDMMPYQCAIGALAYGWRQKGNDKRRFTQAYVKVARKNAKTEFLIWAGTYGFFFEGEKDPEIYWCARQRDQAKKTGWQRHRRVLKKMVERYPTAAKHVKILTHEITQPDGALGRIDFFGQDSEAKDGLVPYYGIFDELHAYNDDKVINVIESGYGGRKNNPPFTWMITTAGYLSTGPSRDILTGAKNMLDGLAPNERFLAFIYELDDDDLKDDRWQNPELWGKANPGLGISLSLEYLLDELHKGKTRGKTKLDDFKVKNLNIELDTADAWIEAAELKALPDDFDENKLQGVPMYGGLDLASTSDFCAYCRFWPSDDPGSRPHVARFLLYLPEDKFKEYCGKVPAFVKWAEDGWIKTVPGNVMEYDWVVSAGQWDMVKQDMQRIGFDPHNAYQTVAQMEASGVKMEPVAQDKKRISPAAKFVEEQIKKQQIDFGGNPVISWMFANVRIERDAQDNYSLNKKKSVGKIDGVMALCNAVYLYLNDTATAAKKTKSTYESAEWDALLGL